MNDRHLRAELDRVTQRYRVFYRSLGLIVLWVALALTALAMSYWARGRDYAPAAWAAAITAVIGLALAPWLLAMARRARDPLWLARRIERRFPDLDARLLAALEQHPDKKAGLGFLQQMVIDQAVSHAWRYRWVELVPAGTMRVTRVANWGMFLLCAAMMVGLALDLKANARLILAGDKRPDGPLYTVKVEPADIAIERGSPLTVLARFGSLRLPEKVELLYRDGADAPVQRIAMNQSLDDPLFGTRLASVKRDGTYAVAYGADETPWYKISVFDYPALKQADAKLKFPEYTGLEEKLVQDTRSVTAVEGTHVTLSFRLNKPVAEARLTPTRRPVEQPVDVLPRGGRGARGGQAPTVPTTPLAPAEPLTLTADPADPTNYTVSLDLKQSQTYQLQLVDADKRGNRDRTQMTLNVTQNRPPELRVLAPGRDLDVSPIEEITVRTQVWDDYGVKRVGMSYALAGALPTDVVLAENMPARERKDLSQIVSLEKLAATPDQLLSYHLWVEDIGPDGKLRRTNGAMYFADVRPFEEIFRQGEAQAAGEGQQQQRQQQQQQQGQQGNQNAQRADQVANTLKQVIAATWNIMRRETAEKPSPQFAPDVKAVESSQARVREQSEGLSEQVTDERAEAFLESGLKNMDKALVQLKAAGEGPDLKPMPEALAAEQAAYQDLLKLRAREFEVRRGQQQQGQQNASQARRQQQLNQMNLANQQNPYQSRRNAQPQQQQPQQQEQAQQETDEQRETRQVLSRLRDLAQRQDDLNRQMQQVQSALQQAQTPEQREELQRQLANLRDQQQQQLRDADELRDRMEQPENQEQMADARQQLEETRNNIQQAAQSLGSGQMQQAAAAGQRAAEQLNNLQEQMRRAAAGQFGQAMTQMRQDARELEEDQQQIDQQLTNLNQPQQQQAAPTGLRNTSEQDAAETRRQIAQELQQQRRQLEELMNNMQQTIEEAETPQPLLSRQLYDTYRNTQQQQPERSLDATRQLVQQGLLQEARQAGTEASQDLTRLREGIDQAAATVLGDETDALRRARNELDALAQQLERERGRQAATQPGRGEGRQLAGGATQPGRGGAQPDERQLADGRGARGNQPGEQGEPGARGNQPGGRGNQPGGRGEQPGDPQDRQLAQGPGQNGGRGNQPQEGQPGAQGGRGQQPGEQPGQQPGGQQPGGQARGQQPGGQQPGGQQPGGQARGQQPGGQQPGGQQPGGQARGQQPGGQQPGGEQPGGQQGGQARGGRGGRGQQGEQGNEPGQGGQPGEQLAQEPGAQEGQEGQEGQGGQGGQGGRGQLAQGGRAGLRDPNAQGRGGRGQQGDPNQDPQALAGDPQAGDPQTGDPQEGQPGRGGQAGGRGGRGNVSANANTSDTIAGPITGAGFRNFTDTLRDIEESIADPALRDRTADIRQATAGLRVEYQRTSRPPSWNIVQDTVSRPLNELRNDISREIQRRESAQAAVPLDRDAVPPAYQEQVRVYYERLGSGQ